MLDTIGISGYIQAVKLSPKPARKNANKLALSVSHESLKRLLSGAPLAGRDAGAGCKKRSLALAGAASGA